MALKDNASLALIPVAYKEDKVYCAIPNDADGDFDFTRGSAGTRVNKAGLIETMPTNTPRLNYNILDGVVQGCPTLLLEPSRTNRITDTEGWSGFSAVNAVLSDNTSITAPDGSATGIKTLTSSSTTQPRIEWRGISVPASTTSYVWSVFVKKGTTRYVALSHFSDSTQWAVFDLDNGVIQDELGSDVPAKIENYGNGWYRISKGATITTGQSTNYFKLTIATPSSPSVGVSGETVDIWGFQIEIGLYLSSFIPTTTVGSITTRSADVCNDAGTSDTFNDSEGVLYGNISALDLSETSSRRLGITKNNTYEGVRLQLGNGNITATVYDGTTNQYSKSVNIDNSIFHKVALKYKTNDFALWIDGIEYGAQASGTTFSEGTLDDISFDYVNGNHFYSNTKQLMTFNESLSDSELEALTSYSSFNEMATEQLYTIE
jgi:hypothetical protein